MLEHDVKSYCSPQTFDNLDPNNQPPEWVQLSIIRCLYWVNTHRTECVSFGVTGREKVIEKSSSRLYYIQGQEVCKSKVIRTCWRERSCCWDNYIGSLWREALGGKCFPSEIENTSHLVLPFVLLSDMDSDETPLSKLLIAMTLCDFW